MKSIYLHQKRGGFTILEIAFCLAIIITGLIAIMGLLSPLLTTNRGTIDLNEMALDVQNFMEEDFYSIYQPGALPSSNFATNRIRGSFRAKVSVVYMTATNAFGTNSANPLPFVDANNDVLLRTVQVTYTWPLIPTNSPPSYQSGGSPPYFAPAAKTQSYTFCTEIVATKDIPLQ